MTTSARPVLLSPESALLASFRAPHLPDLVPDDVRDELLDGRILWPGAGAVHRITTGALALLWGHVRRAVVPPRVPREGAGVA